MSAMTLGDVLDGMFRLIMANWRVYLVALGALIIPFNILNAVFSVGGTGMLSWYADMLRNPGATPSAPPTTESGAAAIIVGSILVALVSFFFVTPVSWGLATHIADGAYRGQTPAPGQVWRATMRRYGALLGVWVLLVLIFIGFAIVFAIVFAIAGAAQSTGFVVFVGVAMIVAALWLLVKLSLAIPPVIVEQAGPGRAIARSWGLVRGRFWRLLGSWVVVAIILIVLTFVFTAGFALVGALAGTFGAVAAGFLGSTLAGILTTPLFLNAALLLYYDSRIRSEAYDLDVMTQGVMAAPPDAPGQPPFA